MAVCDIDVFLLLTAFEYDLLFSAASACGLGLGVLDLGRDVLPAKVHLLHLGGFFSNKLELYTNPDSSSKCLSSRGEGSDSKCSRIQRLEHEHFEPDHIPTF